MNTSLVLISLLLTAMSALSLLMPGYTRPELFFGVTVLHDFRQSAAARRILRGYRAGVCGVGVLALTIVLAMRHPVVALLAHVLGTCAILIAAHHAASTYASPRASIVEVNLSAKPERMPGGVMAPWLPLLWLLGLAVWAMSNMARLPEHLILHYGVHGPARWVATTPLTVMAIIGFTALGCLAHAATAYGVLHWSRRISTAGSAAAGERQFRRLAVMLTLAIEYLIAIIPLLMLLAAPLAWMRAWLVALWVTLIVFCVRLVRAGQGGTRLAAPAGEAIPVGDRTDDAHWLGGLIYLNRADHAVFVEKRMGVGWTMNLGNLRAWLIIAGLILIPPSLRIALSRSSPDTVAVSAQAQSVALAWLVSIDAGEYSHSWETAATLFKNALPEDQWVSRISALRRRLGELRSRSVSSTRVAGALWGTSGAEHVVIKFNTSFAHEAQATETVTPVKDSDGQWRVGGYYVK